MWTPLSTCPQPLGTLSPPPPPGSTFPLTLPLANLTPHLPCLNIANAVTLSSAPSCHGVVAALWFWLAALSLVLDLPSKWAAA